MKRLKKFALLGSLRLGISLTWKAFPSFQRDVSEQSSNLLYRHSPLWYLCFSRVAIEITMSVFGLAFLIEFPVSLKRSFAIDEMQSRVSIAFQANFQWVFDRGTES